MDRSMNDWLDQYAAYLQEQSNNQNPGGLDNNGNDINGQHLQDFFSNLPNMTEEPFMPVMPGMIPERIQSLFTVMRGGRHGGSRPGGSRPRIRTLPAMPAMPHMSTIPGMGVTPDLPRVARHAMNLGQNDSPYTHNVSSNSNASNAGHISNVGKMSVAGSAGNVRNASKMHSMSGVSNSKVLKNSKIDKIQRIKEIKTLERFQKHAEPSLQGPISSPGLIGTENMVNHRAYEAHPHGIIGTENVGIQSVHEAPPRGLIGSGNLANQTVYEAHPHGIIGTENAGIQSLHESPPIGLIGTENGINQPVHQAPPRELISTEKLVNRPVCEALQHEHIDTENVVSQWVHEAARRGLVDTESVSNHPVLEAPPRLIPISLSFMEPQGSSSCGRMSAPRLRLPAPMFLAPTAPESARMTHSRARVAVARGDVGRLGICPVGPMYFEENGINYLMEGNFIGQEQTLPTGHKIWVKPETDEEVYPPNAIIAGRPVGHPSGGFLGFGPV